MPIFSQDLGDLHGAKLPLRFRVGAGSIEHAAVAIGISPQRFIMSCPMELQAGLRLVMKIRVPVEVSGSPFSEIAVRGRVVDCSNLPDGQFGYQIELERD